ncbi:hypothetical protein PLESTF_000102400 [Pleodorina starrii]|nr:hypothetical protein PLESTM_001268000 [Pleodorina starrii]GLC63953.1 hypothetical protein PLESTF_000102400 [Pleodorina starrii]
MNNVDQVEAARLAVRAPAAQPGPQKSGVGNRGSSAYHAPSDVNACASHTSSSGALGALPTVRSAPFSAISLSYAAVAGARRQAGLTSTDKVPPYCDSLNHSSQGPTSSHHHAGGKRPRTMAFSGDAASTQTEPSQPSQLRRLTSLTAHSRQETAEEGHNRHHASSASPGARQAGPQAPQLSEADHRTCVELRQGAFIQQLVGATNCHGSDARGRCPATNAAPTAPGGVPTVIGGLGSDGGHQLAAFLAANSPSVLEQLLATAGVAPAPTQGRQGAAATTSSFSLSGLAGFHREDAHPKGAQHAQDELPRAAEPDPHRRPRGQASASTTPAGLRADGSAASLAGTITGRAGGGIGHGGEAGPVGGGSGTEGDGCGRKGGALAQDKPSGSAADAVCGARRARDGGEEAAGAGVAAEGRAGLAGPASRSRTAKYNDAAARSSAVEQARVGQASRQGGMSTDAPLIAAGPGAAAAGHAVAGPPDQQHQPTEPVSAHLRAEVAARLKKPIRIIQPISQAWVEETLQSAGGAAGAAAPSVSKGPAAPAYVPAVASASFPQAPLHQAKPRMQSHCPAVAASKPVTSTMASELPGEPSLRDMPVYTTKAAPAVCTSKAASSAPKQPAPPAGRTAAADLSPLAALAPALAALASLPPSDTASPFTISSLGVWSPLACDSGPAGSGATLAAAALPRNYESNTNTNSAMPVTAAPSPFSSGVLPPASSSGTMRPGAANYAALVTAPAIVSAAAAADAAAGGATAAATVGGGSAAATAAIVAGLEALAAANPTMAALVAAGAAPAAPPVNAASGAHRAARSPPDPLLHNRVGAAAGLTPPLPSQVRQLQATPVASTAGSTSASCLGKVQGELTLLYQWYVANKAVYLDQAQRQLQRIEALTAARDGAADAAAASFARAESAEAMRAFETALKIMSVCGRVEQQWLAGPAMAAAAGGGAVGAAVAGTTAADMGRGLAPELPPQAPGGSTGLQLPANVPAPSGGWAHGASAALAVAAALVGSVGQGQCPAPEPGGPGPRDNAAGAAGAPGRVPSPRGVAPTSVVGVAPLALRAVGARPATGMPQSLSMQGLQAVAAGDPRPAVAGAMAPPRPSPAARGAAAASPPATAPISPVTAA